MRCNLHSIMRCVDCRFDSDTVQEQSVQARGPPEKAQAILSTPPGERGSVASSSHNTGGCGHMCGK
jgi:hypothetical protein